MQVRVVCGNVAVPIQKTRESYSAIAGRYIRTFGRRGMFRDRRAPCQPYALNLGADVPGDPEEVRIAIVVEIDDAGASTECTGGRPQ